MTIIILSAKYELLAIFELLAGIVTTKHFICFELNVQSITFFFIIAVSHSLGRTVYCGHLMGFGQQI